MGGQALEPLEVEPLEVAPLEVAGVGGAPRAQTPARPGPAPQKKQTKPKVLVLVRRSPGLGVVLEVGWEQQRVVPLLLRLLPLHHRLHRWTVPSPRHQNRHICYHHHQ